MTRKLLFGALAFLAGTVMMFAQNPLISIVGGSAPGGWSGDLDMATTDGVNYTYTGLVVTVPAQDPGIKFRRDHDWPVNWGGSGFPNGTATQNGANIPATNGIWDVAFNITTGVYSFTPAGVVYDMVALAGNGAILNFVTTDGIHYHSNGAALEEGIYYFTINGAGQYGGTGFPNGTATDPGTITVPGNTYNITYDAQTSVYNFSYVTISVIGSGVVNWDTDVDLVTTDGVLYTLASQAFAGGEMKFRQNHNWDVSWGSGVFPSGTLESPGENFVVPAGIYMVTFNRTTAEFIMSDLAGVDTVVKNNIVAYPNPASTGWNLSTHGNPLTNVKITDATGKVMVNQSMNTQQTVINASGLATGVYFASVTAGSSTTVIRLVKN